MPAAFQYPGENNVNLGLYKQMGEPKAHYHHRRDIADAKLSKIVLKNTYLCVKGILPPYCLREVTKSDWRNLTLEEISRGQRFPLLRLSVGKFNDFRCSVRKFQTIKTKALYNLPKDL